MRSITQGHWEQWKTDKNLHCRSQVRILFRAEAPIAIYGADNPKFKNEMLLGAFDFGDCEIQWDRAGMYVRLSSEGRVWFKTFEAANAVERQEIETFVSLERPNRLSPEMQAIMRMVRKNEIEREQQREENARIQNDLRRIKAASAKGDSLPQGTATPEKPKAKASAKPQPSGSDAEKRDVSKVREEVPQLDDSAGETGSD